MRVNMGSKMHRARLHCYGRIEEKSHIKVGDKRMRMSKDRSRVLTPPPLMGFITKDKKENPRSSRERKTNKQTKKNHQHVVLRPMDDNTFN